MLDLLHPTLLLWLETCLWGRVAVFGGVKMELDSKAPVVLKQDRLGGQHKIFGMYKLRSMVSRSQGRRAARSLVIAGIIENYGRHDQAG